MKKGIILFDIDKTIFNTESMSKEIDRKIIELLHHPDHKLILEAKSQYKNTLTNERYFVPEDYIKILCKKINFNNKKSLEDIFYAKKYAYIYKENVYEETFEIIDKLKNSYQLGIFSEGTSRFQNNKFYSMNLDKFFNKDLIFIVNEKDTKEAIDKIPKNAIVVDDKETICQFLTDNGIRAIWLNRKDNRKSDSFKTIHSLLELLSIL